MPKKLRQHTIHWSEDVEAIARAGMKMSGAASLNGHVEIAVRMYEESLRICASAAVEASRRADAYRELMDSIRADEKKRKG